MLKYEGIDPLLSNSRLMKGEYGNGELTRVISKACLGLPKESNGVDRVEVVENL